jgi:hypothetical protein
VLAVRHEISKFINSRSVKIRPRKKYGGALNTERKAMCKYGVTSIQDIEKKSSVGCRFKKITRTKPPADCVSGC